MSLGSSLYILPCEDLLDWEHGIVAHYLMALLSDFVVYKVADKKVKLFVTTGKFSKGTEDLSVCDLFYPIVRINDFKEKTCCILNSGIDC